MKEVVKLQGSTPSKVSQNSDGICKGHILHVLAWLHKGHDVDQLQGTRVMKALGKPVEKSQVVVDVCRNLGSPSWIL